MLYIYSTYRSRDETPKPKTQQELPPLLGGTANWLSTMNVDHEFRSGNHWGTPHLYELTLELPVTMPIWWNLFDIRKVTSSSPSLSQSLLLYRNHGFLPPKDRQKRCCIQDEIDMSPRQKTGWWLTHPSEKYEFVSWDHGIPNWMESHKIPWFQTTNQIWSDEIFLFFPMR